MAQIKIDTFSSYSLYASYFVNGDASGLSGVEKEQADHVLKSLLPIYGQFNIVGADSDYFGTPDYGIADGTICDYSVHYKQESGLSLTDYGNYITTDVKRQEKVVNFFYKLADYFGECDNLPKITREPGYWLVKFGSWHIKLSGQLVRIEPAFTNVIALPPIYYNELAAIELDFFVDLSTLVGIWLQFSDGRLLRLLRYNF